MSQEPRYTSSTLLDVVNIGYSQQVDAALKGLRELRERVDHDRDITENETSLSTTSYLSSIFVFVLTEDWIWAPKEIFTIHPFVGCFGACWDFFFEELQPFLVRVAEQEIGGLLLQLQDPAPELTREADLERKYGYLTLRFSYEGMVSEITSAFTFPRLGAHDRELFGRDSEEVYANDPRFRVLKNIIKLDTYLKPVINDPNQFGPALMKRYFHGILRDAQIRLILSVVYATIAQIRGLITIPVDQLPATSKMVWRGKDGDLKYHSALATLVLEVTTICSRNSVLIKSLLAHPEFRSERLETLLLSYLLEDDVNLQLTRELSAIDGIAVASLQNEFSELLGLPVDPIERELIVIDRSDRPGGKST